MELKDRVAVVTGAAQGLGRSIALAMAEAGARVVLCDVNEEGMAGVAGEIEAMGGQAMAVRCDVSSSAAVQDLFSRAKERFGTVHILVNNAARVPSSPAEAKRRSIHYEYITHPLQPRRSLGIVASLSDDDWLKWWDVNTHGVFYCLREAVRIMEPQRYGRIVNIASVAGISAASVHSPGYSASKAAVVSLTKTAALDVAGANIAINAIACGGILTPPFQAYLDSATEEQRLAVVSRNSLGRLGRPEEYASLAVYLAGDRHYLIGQVISPNGGSVV